ncbi:MAG: hypothetical protein GX783_13655 [Clostridiales bacterium]|nr:hypothetical protein [Clostridiales bacterium]
MWDVIKSLWESKYLKSALYLAFMLILMGFGVAVIFRVLGLAFERVKEIVSISMILFGSHFL